MDIETKNQLDGFWLGEILKNKAVWLHACYASILPRPLFNQAARDTLPAATQWAKENGYALHEMTGETQLRKGTLVVGRFRPHFDGEGEDKKLRFEATIFGKQVPTASLAESIRAKN